MRSLARLSSLAPNAPPHLAGGTFERLFGDRLHKGLVDELRGMGIERPTEVQEKTIGALLNGENAIVVSPTGSGKTFAYLTPMVEHMRSEAADLRPTRPTTLVVVPSRELCMQVLREAKHLTKSVGKLRAEGLIGGSQWKKRTSRDVLGHKVDLLVCTPGIFLKLRDQKQLFSSDVSRVVFDEADTLFSKGFVSEMESIMMPILGMGEKLGKPRQIVAVGATMPSAVLKRIDRVALRKVPRKVIHASRSHFVPRSLSEEWVRVATGDKMPFLTQALSVGGPWKKCLVFVNTPDCARAVEHFLYEKGHAQVSSFHRDLPAKLREESLQDFRNGTEPQMILVSTDAGSRGLDLPDLDLVINYDFPPSVADYLHRVGRTARMGRTGRTVSLVQTKQDRAIALGIQALQQGESGGDLSSAIEKSDFNLYRD